MPDPRAQREAQVLAEYLLPGSSGEEVTRLYLEARSRRGLDLAAPDRATSLALSLPSLLGLLDAGLALARPDHELRRKLLVMTAILECRPGLSERFLPRERGSRLGAWLRVALAGLRGCAKALLGVPLALLLVGSEDRK